MPLKSKLDQEKPWTILCWTRKQWKQSKMWKKAGVSEEKMARLMRSLDHETVQKLKNHAQAEVLVDKIFGINLAVDSGILVVEVKKKNTGCNLLIVGGLLRV